MGEKYEGTMEEFSKLTKDPHRTDWQELDAWQLASEERREKELGEAFGENYTKGRHTAELVKDRLILSWNEKTSPAGWLDLDLPIRTGEPFIEGVFKDLHKTVPMDITFCVSQEPLEKESHLVRLIGETRRTGQRVFTFLCWVGSLKGDKSDFGYAPINKEAREIHQREPEDLRRRYIESLLIYIVERVLH